MSAATSKPRTTISQAAARLAVLVAPKGEPDQTLGRVLVEDEAVVACDSKRMLIVTEPHEGGLYSQQQQVALVPCDSLADARRDAERISVEHHRLTAMDDKGVSLRFVPFGDAPADPWPAWRDIAPGHAPSVGAFNPHYVGDVLKQLAALNVTRVSLHKSGDLLCFEAELPDSEQRVRLLVMSRDASSEVLPGVPVYERKGGDENGALKFEQEGDTAVDGDERPVYLENERETVKTTMGGLRRAAQRVGKRLQQERSAPKSRARKSSRRK